MKQKAAQKLIYKIHTKQLKRANWDLDLPLETALRDYPDLIVALNDSQMLRWIDELNGVEDYDAKVKQIQRSIKNEKKRPKSTETKVRIRSLYNALYRLQFQPDYVCVVMDSNKDYDRANQGFKINGARYHRLLGTNGGVKTSTIVYVNDVLWPELRKRIDNGRNMEKELVPAKFEAYCALTCSGSTPIPQPNGVIVVHDCMTKFKDDVILINTDTDGEPELTYEDGYEIEHDASDGNGMISPAYSRRVNGFLNGDPERTLSGFNLRNAWTKGMLYTFDFVEFAEKVAGTYFVKDVWGDVRDVREADMILTESMLKLYDSYDSWEDYAKNCVENHYLFSATKDTPEKLENVRDSNYQFLQDIDMTDEEIDELCESTVREINDVLGGDYRKSLAFLCGQGMDDREAVHTTADYVKALMVEPAMINDPYVRRNIHSMIKKRIDSAKKGSIRLNANFAMLGGDLYALCQSMFGLPVTGLLHAGEIYHRYWTDKEVDEVCCFRAPMTSIHNIRRMKLNKSDEALHWFQYIKTACLINAWDTMADALNGCDFDGDTVFTTNTRAIIKNTPNARTILCLQKKAKKKVPQEEDIIEGNKKAFNDDIGVVTNHVTAMIEACAGFEDHESNEYKTLRYRVMCGQAFQQETIDRIKGIVCKPMPSCWFSYRDIDSVEDEGYKKLCREICAPYKPYFMRYVYSNLNKQIDDYINGNDKSCRRNFAHLGICTLEELRGKKFKVKRVKDFLSHYDTDKKIGMNPCTVNRICWHIEKTFPNYGQLPKPKDFDYTIMKSGVEYSQKDYQAISDLYRDYQHELQQYMKFMRSDGYMSEDELPQTKDDFIRRFRMKAEIICPNEKELCDIVLDLCYHKEGSKQFAWVVAGEQIIENLLSLNGGMISYPKHGDSDTGNTFTYGGETYTMTTVCVLEEPNEDYTE